MNIPENKLLIIRVIMAVAIAGAALVFFFLSRSTVRQIENAKETLSPAAVTNIDREVDTVLAHFRIERAWIRKSSVSIPNSSIVRIERRVAIPKDVIPVQMNVALSAMARRYSARAIASENLKENSVTIHIELSGFIVQTIILKTNPDLKRSIEKTGQTKV